RLADVSGLAGMSLPGASRHAPGGGGRQAFAMRSARLWLVILLLAFTVLVLHLRGDVDHVPPSRPLSQFPTTIGTRLAYDITMDPETLQILGKGDFLNRLYQTPPAPWGSTSPVTMDADARASIGLFIGYFPTQRS